MRSRDGRLLSQTRAISPFLQPQLYCFSPGGACSGKDSVSVAGVAPLSSDATQSPAHSLVPLTVPTSLQPVGSFGFTRVCRHLSQTSAQTRCNPARKFRAVFS